MTDPHIHPSAPASRRAIRFTLAVVVPAALATVIGLIVLWPKGSGQAEPWGGPDNFHGKVMAVTERACLEEEGTPDPAKKCGDVRVALTEGPQAGAEVTTSLPIGPGAGVFEPGDKIIVIRTERADQPGAVVYSILDHDRASTLWLLLLAFALAVIAFGRWRGLTALIGLAITFGLLLMFVVPAILQGEPPLLVAIVGSAAIMLVVLYLTHGFSIPTSMAVLGTLISLTLTGLLGAFSTSLLQLTGVGTEEASFLSMQYQNVNLLGLLLAGIIIGALGVLDDVTVTQAYTVTELAQANPNLGFRSLYAAAARVGRAHIASVINTIVLAYAGASLPLLLLLTAGGAPLKETLTSEAFTQEILRSAVGTMGLVAAVPITTALAALASAGLGQRDTGERTPKPPKARKPRRLDPLEHAWDLPDEVAP